MINIINQRSHSEQTAPGASDAAATSIKYLLILVQLAVLAWLINRYAIEQILGLPHFIPYVVSGFFIHALLPFKWRLPFFFLLSVGALFWILNWVPALTTLSIFAIFFGILQIPISVTYRSIALAIAAACLAWVWVSFSEKIPDSIHVVPIIGSIFMFRASVYLYDIRYEKKPAPFLQQLAYFLMLPNLVFTLFPVVDYKIFQRAYYSKAPLEIYQQGTRWMIRGFFHLMLYRIIYYYVQPPLGEVDSLLSFVLYAATSYLLILRLSGLFHSAIGILCLFGFNLPIVFHNYFFASGFSDLWRRINIYWRDYIMKVFYYPIYFKLRNIGKISGMVISILLAFGITWMLHSFQWFWLQGSFPLRAIDAAFWGIFGLLVAASSVYQQLVPKKDRFGFGKPYWVQAILRATQIAAMFAFMSLLWSFWNSPSVSLWWEFMTSLKTPSFTEWTKLLLFMLSGILIGGVGFFLFDKTKLKGFLEPDDGKMLSVFWGGLTLSVFALCTIPSVLNMFQGFTDKPVEHIYEKHLTEADDALMIKGYYEDILITNQLTSPLSEEQQRPDDWLIFSKTELAVPLNNWVEYDLRPNVNIEFKGAPISTNSLGMRDREYSKVKPPNTFRTGILGGSYVMGSGVKDDQVFDELLENKFNETRPFDKQYEFLNFSVPGYHLLELTSRLETKVQAFEMDALIIVSHGVDIQKALEETKKAFSENMPIDLDFVMEGLAEEGFSPGMDMTMNARQTQKINTYLVNGCYERISQICQRKGIQPILVYWPRTRQRNDNKYIDQIFEIARKHGFIILDLSSVYDDYTLEEITLTSFDSHPNILGHQLIAAELYKQLLSNPEILKIIEK